MKTYDVISRELLLDAIDLNNWSPDVVTSVEVATARNVTWATPAQVATFLTFEPSSTFNGYLSPDYAEGTREVQENWRRKALESQRNNGWHQAGFVAAVALWHVRHEPVDLVRNYAGYSSVMKGHRISPDDTALPIIAPHIAEKAEEYEWFLEKGITNRQDAICCLLEQSFPELSEQLMGAVTEWVDDYPAYRDLPPEQKLATVRFIIGFSGIEKASETFLNDDLNAMEPKDRMMISAIERLDSYAWQ